MDVKKPEHAGFSDISGLLGSLVDTFKGFVGRLDGGLDSSNSHFGTSRSRSQSLFNQARNLGIGFSNLGFDLLGDLVLGLTSDGDHVTGIFNTLFDRRGSQLFLQGNEGLNILGTEQRGHVAHGGFENRASRSQVQKGHTLNTIKSGGGKKQVRSEAGLGEILGFGHHNNFLHGVG